MEKAPGLEEIMQRKMKLDLERLDVDSFQTDAVPAETGTVHGHGPTGTGGGQWSVNPNNTCGQATCVAVVTCIGETCGTCDTAYRCTYDTSENCTFWCPTGGENCMPVTAVCD
ncbi:hypothetical protein [Longimicrobium sp.]|uniref:hypothetical protein n=1 Tax=Longimicrobium sp. TaxID=2029185 RepID=UPI002E2F2AB3|nr:hypothetical protein [Longimicrobium sp.]HEX6041206.1 hypothetical protein [Longimicrobium sp.]